MTFSRGTLPSEWTAEENDRLEQLVRSGHSSGQIAKLMDKSRSAVVGRVSRAGLKLKGKSWGGKTRNPNLAPRVRSVPVVRALPVFKAPSIVPEIALEPSRNVALLELSPSDCRWPSAGVGEHTLFCGHPRAGSSYCSHHHGIVYVPIELRRRAA